MRRHRGGWPEPERRVLAGTANALTTGEVRALVDRHGVVHIADVAEPHIDRCHIGLQVRMLEVVDTRTQQRQLRSSHAAYQPNTRKARSVFQRLGRPSPSSVSTGISPEYRISSGHRSSLSRLDSTKSIASATRSSGATPARRRYSSPRSTS